jgi:aldose 1-epimerase
LSNFVALPNEISLLSEGVFALVSPVGASLTNLSVAGHTIIEHVSAQAAKQSFAAATLAPWPNRLRDGQWVFQGQSFQFANLDDDSNANHGLVFDRKFSVVRQTSDFVEFSIELGDDAGYPFRVQLAVSYQLVAGGVDVNVSATNVGDKLAPMAFGSHPYIAVDAASTIHINALTQMVNDGRQIPVGREIATKNFDANGGQLNFDGLKLDDCFADLVRDENGNATTTVVRSSGDKIEIWQDSSFRYLMVYAHHQLSSQGMQSEGIAIEPQTAPANALQSGEDLFMLEPGQQRSARWGVMFKPIRSEND